MEKKKGKKNTLRKQHKDTMFREFFKVPQNFLDLLKECRDNQLSLVIDDIEPFDLESNIAIRTRRNDVSFITKDNHLIILIEHQSTINPKMALRLFIYFTELLQLWLKTNKINLYSATKLPDLPIPEFYVVYNGVAPLKETSSVFKLESSGMKIDAEVKIIDIHFDKLKDTESDNALAGYAFFYKVYAEQVKKGLSAEKAFEIARNECIKRSYMTSFISKEEFIVFYKDFMDYDMQLRTEGIEKGREEGIIEGISEGIEKAIRIAIQNNAPLSLIEAMAKEANISQKRLDDLICQAAL